MSHEPLRALASRAWLRLRRRWVLYAAATLAAIAAQGAVVAVWHSPAALECAAAAFMPLLTALTYAGVLYDDQERAELSIAARFMERAWAVVVIQLLEFGIEFVRQVSATADDAGAVIGGSLLMVVSATLVYADASATADPDFEPLLVVPRSIWRSVQATWRPGLIWRAFAIYIAGTIVLSEALGLFQLVLTNAHVAGAAFWANIPLGTIAIPPFAAFTLLVYLDAKRS